MKSIGPLQVVTFAHPQGCRGYLIADAASKEALALDPHLDLVNNMAERLAAEGWTLRAVVDTHTHADHPSGAGALAARFNSVRMTPPIVRLCVRSRTHLVFQRWTWQSRDTMPIWQTVPRVCRS